VCFNSRVSASTLSISLSCCFNKHVVGLMACLVSTAHTASCIETTDLGPNSCAVYSVCIGSLVCNWSCTSRLQRRYPTASCSRPYRSYTGVDPGGGAQGARAPPSPKYFLQTYYIVVYYFPSLRTLR